MTTCTMIAVTGNYIPLAQMWYYSFKANSGITGDVICFVDTESTRDLVKLRLPDVVVRVLSTPSIDNYAGWEDNYFYGMRMKIFGLYALQGTYERCVYFDVDTLVLKNLHELYDLDLEGNVLAGVPDCQQHRHPDIPCDSAMADEMQFRVDIAGGMDKYINAGMLVVDLNKLPLNTFEDYVAQEQPYCSDQDYLNEVCSGKCMILPDTYNYMINYWLLSPSEELTKETHEAMGNAHIQHFHGAFKPWSKTYSVWCWWLKLQYNLTYYEQVLAACRGSFGDEASSYISYADAEVSMREGLSRFHTDPTYQVHFVQVGEMTHTPCGCSEWAHYLAQTYNCTLVTDNPTFSYEGSTGVVLDVGDSRIIPKVSNSRWVVIADATEDVGKYDMSEVYPVYPLKYTSVGAKLKASESALLDALEVLLPKEHPVRAYRDAIRNSESLITNYDTRGK